MRESEASKKGVARWDQPGTQVNGIHEVMGSIPISSTNFLAFKGSGPMFSVPQPSEP
jgi:hypothetical protein